MIRPSPNPNHQVTWLPTRPELTITRVRTVGRMCYSETTYEIVSRVKLDQAALEHLDACGLLGFGQSYQLIGADTITDEVLPVVVDRRSGQVLPDVVPVNEYSGEAIIDTHAYEYHRYQVRRICDSGD